MIYSCVVTTYQIIQNRSSQNPGDLAYQMEDKEVRSRLKRFELLLFN